MKRLLSFATAIIATAMLWFTGCSTTASNGSEIGASQKEMALRQAGFIPKTVTTPQQEQQVAKLPPGVVSAVKYKGKLLYAYPTGKGIRSLLVGKLSPR